MNRLAMGISAFWLIMCIVRIGLHSTAFANTRNGEIFMAIFNVLLIIGIVLIAFVFFRGYFRRAAAKVHSDTHCSQCYAKIEPGAEFCPSCGFRFVEEKEERPKYRPLRLAVAT